MRLVEYGSALVKRFCDEGATLIGCDLNLQRLNELAQQLGLDDQQFHRIELDITDRQAVMDFTADVWQRIGPIDALVNNAGFDMPVQFIDSDPDDWDKLIAINLYGPLHLQRAIVPRMVENGAGKVVNISSDAGRVGSSGEAVYSACKGGIIAFSKSLARELARSNIQVNVVCPGPTETPLLSSFVGEGDYGQRIVEGLKRAIPMRRLGQPEDLAGAVAFLASSDADFVTGQTISVSGGLTMHG